MISCLHATADVNMLVKRAEVSQARQLVCRFNDNYATRILIFLSTFAKIPPTGADLIQGQFPATDIGIYHTLSIAVNWILIGPRTICRAKKQTPKAEKVTLMFDGE